MTAPARRALGRFKLELSLAALVVLLFANYLFSDQLLFGTDSSPGGLFFRALVVDFVRQFGQLPRWNPYILGGLPFLDATHGDTLFPSSLLHFVMPVYRGLGHKLLLHVFLAGVFMAFYLRTRKLRPAAVWWGSFAYMLCPIFASYIYAGQDGKMYVTSLTPLVIGLLERGMRTGRPAMFAWLGVSIGLAILSAHVQMAYHLMWFVGALFLFRLVRPEAEGEERVPRVRAGLLFTAAVVIGLLIASIQLFPAVGYVKHPGAFSVRSTRTDYEHATSWSLHPEEIASLAVPEFCNSPRGYWGRNPFKLNSDYTGIVVLFLGAVALTRRDPTRWFLAGLAAFCILYSLGGLTPVHRLFYAVVPQVKIFRAPPLVMFGVAFAWTALAAHAVHDLDGARVARAGPRRLSAFGMGAAGLLALAGLAADATFAAWNELFRPDLDPALRQEQLANLPAFRRGALIVAVVLAAAAWLVDAALRGRVSKRTAVIGLILLSVFDAWRVDRRFVAVVDPRPFIEPRPLIAQIQLEGRTEKFRVMPIAPGMQLNELGYFRVESVLGIHDNELSWYRALRMEPVAQSLLATNATGYPLLRVLNVKYILHDQPGVPNPFPVPGYLPRFWLAPDWEIAKGPAEIVPRLLDDAFDPARSVLLEEEPGIPRAGVAADSIPGVVTGHRYAGNEIHVDVDAARPCLLVHAENWFPYWHAFVDGAEVPILRAYGAIRAIAVPAGRHEVVLRFRSAPFEWGRTLSLATIALLLLAWGFSLARRSARSRGTS